jgi:hypothetical protein
MKNDLPQLSEVPPDLAAVAAAADAQVSGAIEVPPPPGQAPPEPPDPGAELAAMLQMGVTMFAPVLPFLPECYPKATCEQIGTAFAAVAQKYGWDLDLLNSPELALAIVAVPPTISAVVQGRAYFAKKKADAAAAEKAKREASGIEPTPAQASGTFGPPNG